MTQFPTLKKPPVTEVYADLVFEGEPGVKWSHQRASALLEQMVPDAKPELMPKVEYQVVQGTEGTEIHLNPGFERVRIWSIDRRQCIQVGPNRLVLNRVKVEDYPRFHHLDPFLEQYLHTYCAEYNPAGIISAALGYVDDVHLPSRPGEVVQLGRYFNVSVSSPPSFGPVIKFAATMNWQTTGNATTQLEFRSGAGYNFKLLWLAGSEIRSPVDLAIVRERLSESHLRIRQYFFETFTPEGIALFDPVWD